MDATLNEPSVTSEQDRQISAAVRREGRRLRNFIRKRVLDAAEAEDILQDVLYELVAAHRLMQPIGQAGAWLLRVARNRIIDRFRKNRIRGRVAGPPIGTEDQGLDSAALEDLLPALDPGPEGEAIRQVLLEQVEDALDELPREQREVFIAHELEGASFKELAARWGVNVNTLLARKRYAIAALREQLQAAYDEWLDE
ncbi:MAG: RNA polymerase sigma factor [Steroidobacteraceae bacterium]